MTIFNSFSINIGFNFGMNNWFNPISSCFGGFSGFNGFGGFNMCNMFSNPFITSPLPTFNFSNIWSGLNFNNFNPSINLFSGGFNSSIWNNTGSALNFSNTSIWGNTTFSNSSSNSTAISTSTSKESSSTNSPSKNTSVSSSKNKSITIDGYNAEKGKKLAEIGLKKANGWKNQCATYVKNAIQEAGLGKYENGHAYQMTNILRRNKNFREITVTDSNYKNLPAGCILVFGKKVSGYSSQYGHVEITTGDGRAVSDGITNNIRKPSAIFIPV